MRLALIFRWLLLTFCGVFSTSGSQIIYVNQSAAGSTQNGASWNTAYHELRDALPSAGGSASVNNPVEIWVTAGTYKPTADNMRTKSFALPGNVTIRGGFAGTESDPSQRPATGYWTVLSGDIGTADTSGVTAANIGAILAGTRAVPTLDPTALPASFNDNSYNVVTCEGVNNVMLDSVIITGGNANNTSANGAAIRTLGDIASMTTLDFGSDSNPSLVGSPLVLPDPVVSGGGVFVTNYYSRPANQTTLTLYKCVFIRNAATHLGGAVAAFEANLNLTGCSFLGNFSQQQGGAFGGLNEFSSFENCTFSNNAAYYYGGAVYFATLPSAKTIPNAIGIQQEQAVMQSVGASLKLVYSVGKLVASKTTDEAGPFADFNFDSFIENDPENVGLDAATAAESSAIGVGDFYAGVGIAMGIGSLAGDMAIAFGANPNSSAYQGWLKTSTFFNTYLSPVGILTILSNLTGGSLGSLLHQSSDEDNQNAYMTQQVNNYNTAPYSTVKDCTFANNSAQGQGGAAVVLYDNVQFDRCWFVTNSASSSAGAVALMGWNTPRVFNCAFSGNNCAEGYSGIYNSFHARSQIINDTFIGNYSSANGDAGDCIGSELGSVVKVFNSVLWGNNDVANPNGGADLFVATSQNISGNVQSAYDAAGPGRGDYVATLDLRFSTVQSFNSLPQGYEEYEIYPWNAGSFLVSISEQYFQQADQNGFADLAGYVNLGEGIRSGSFQVIQGQNSWGNNAINPQLTGQASVVPLFNSPVRNSGSFNLWDFSATFNISVPLPIFSAGVINPSSSENNFFSGPNTFDALATTPIYDVYLKGGDALGTDRGCVQYQGLKQQGLQSVIFYVRSGAPANGDGKSWATAYSSLAPVLASGGNFPGGSQVWVAQGTYTVAIGQIPPNTALYGGFVGNETSLDQRDIVDHPTIYVGFLEAYSQAALDGFILSNYHGSDGPPLTSGGYGYQLNLNNCIFTNNTGGYSGAIEWNGPVVMSNCVFNANSGYAYGAIYADAVTAINCWFQNNSSPYAGGAIWADDYIQAINCVFTGNNAPEGSAILVNTGGPGNWHLCNDTFFGNGPDTIGIAGSYDSRYPTLGVYGPAPSPVNCLFWGNISDGLPAEPYDPLLLNPPALNFQLSPNSPAIDAGSTNGLPLNFPTIDMAGNPRIVNGRIDLGAFEFQAGTGYQTAITLSGTNQIFSVVTGTNATPASLQWQVNTGNGVWVNLANNSTYQGVNTLQLTVYVNASLYGYQYRLIGMVGGSAVQFTPAGLVSAAPSGIFYVRQGAAGTGDGSSWQNAYASMTNIVGSAGDNPIQVWVAKGTYNFLPGQVSKGIQIYGGFNGTETDATQRNPSNNPTILAGNMDCRGGIYLDGLIFTNSYNQFGYAAVSYSGSLGSGYPTGIVNNCLFINTSNAYAGAINWYGQLNVSNCQFIANQTPDIGAGLEALSVTAVNCLFQGNHAGFEGGAIYFTASATIINCAFLSNSVGSYGNGSAIYGSANSAASCQLYNDSFFGNGQLAIVDTASSGYNIPIVPVNCLFWQDATDNVPAQVFPGLSSNPFYLAPAAGNLQLNAWSPAVGGGTTNSLPVGFPTTDLAGNPRFVNGRLDLGAYQFQGTPITPPAYTVTASAGYFINGLFGPDYNITVDIGTNVAPTALQWQVNTGNGLWLNVTNGTAYQGVNALQLVVANPPPAAANYQYQLTGVAANGAHFELLPVSVPWSNLAASYTASQNNNGGFNPGGQWRPVYNISASLGSAAAGASLQWQINSNGVWMNLTNGLLYQGVNSQQLTITDPSGVLNGYQYRLTGTVTNGTFTLTPVTLILDSARTYYVDGTRGYSYYTNWIAVHGSAPMYDGTSWTTAYPTLHEALASASPGSEIWVRSGTYYPLRTFGEDGYPLPSALSLAKGVRLLGGFNGTETSVSQRNWLANLTIINCVSNAPGDDPGLTQYQYAASPSIFVNGASIKNDTVLDGFTLSGATAGAIVNRGGSPSIANCVFINNTAAQGAAVGSWSNASPVIANCILSTNVAQQGTLYFNNATGLVENCLLSFNNSILGGTVYGTNSTVSLLNCAVVFNTAAGGASGGLVTAGGSATCVNNILWGDSGAQVSGAGNNSISYSCVQGGGATNHNYALDPIFVLPASNNFQLAATSPLLTNGSATAAAGLSIDLNGNVREVSGQIDLGPYEYQGVPRPSVSAASLPYFLNVTNFGVYSLSAAGLPATFANIQWQFNVGGTFVPVTNTVLLNYSSTLSGNTASLNLYLTNGANLYNSLSGLLYRFIEPDLNFTSPPALLTVKIPQVLFVNASSTSPSPNGTNWNSAFTSLGQALAVAATNANVGAIWIAQGTYVMPDSSTTLNVQLYGGFAGTETLPSQRNWTNHVTILTATGCAEAGGLDGITIQGSTDLQNGLVVNFASPLIQNCRFTGGNNQLIVNGGLPILANCIFTNAAGGLFITAGQVSITNCTFTSLANAVTATGNAAGAAISHGYFTGNTGVSVQDIGAVVSVSDSLFTGNTGNSIVHYGSQGGTMSVINCTFTANSQPNGAITASGPADANGLQVENCILWNNLSTGWNAYVSGNPAIFTPAVTGIYSNVDVSGIYTYNGMNYVIYSAQALAAQNAGQIASAAAYQSQAAQIVAQSTNLLTGVGYNCIQGLTFFSGNNNINEDPLFMNPAAGNYLTGPWSPAQDAGNSGFVIAGDTDLAGQPRVSGPAVDLGAYEVPTASLGVIGFVSNPQSVMLTVPGSTSFTTVVAPNSSLANYAWQINNGSGWTTVTSNTYLAISNNANTTTLRVNPLDLTQNGLQFRLAALTVTNTSSVATLGVIPNAPVAQLDQSATIFAVLPVGTDASTYVWQYNSGSGWVIVTNGLGYAITYSNNTSTLTVRAAIPSFNGQYRLVAGDNSFMSAAATFTTYVPPVLYVNPAAIGNNTGTNWDNALTNLATALTIAQPGEQVWVVAGTYQATNSAGNGVTWPLNQGALIYGGFMGTETSLAQRNLNLAPTVLVAGPGATLLLGQAGSGSASTVLEGFTITGGNGQPALVNTTTPITVQDCVFSNNLAGAVVITNVTTTFSNCLFAANAATNGAAILFNGSSNNLYGCQFLTNSARLEGGAIYGQVGYIVATNCTFAGNTAGDDGGAINLQGKYTLTLALSSLTGNTASNGGAIYYYDTDANAPANNLYCNLIANNHASGQGGGFYWSETHYGGLFLYSCTVTGNTSGGHGGGVYAVTPYDSSDMFYNSIFWGNRSQTADTVELQQIYDQGFLSSIQTFYTLSLSGYYIPYYLPYVDNIIEDLNLYNRSGAGYYLQGAYGNFNLDPAFVNPAAGNFQLQSFSPAIDAGDKNYTGIPGPYGAIVGFYNLTNDLAGNPRVYNGILDLGAYEVQTNQTAPFQNVVLPVSQSVCDNGSTATFTLGASGPFNLANVVWQINQGGGFVDVAPSAVYNVITTTTASQLMIQPATLAMDGNQFRFRVSGYNYVSPSATLSVNVEPVVYVNAAATGNNSGMDWANAFTNLSLALTGNSCAQIWVAQGTYTIPVGTNGATSFRLRQFMDLRGGFAGTETNVTQRDYVQHPTILAAAGGQSIFFNDGTAAPIDSTAILDGFILTGAVGNPAILNIDAAPIVRNCVFTNNAGRAIQNQGILTGANGTILNCQFVNNSGGGILNRASSPLITNCVFRANATSAFGAGVDNEQGGPVISGCLFENNSASLGGGFYNNSTNAGTMLARDIFRGNTASQGGAINDTAGSPLTIRDSLLTKNTASIQGGAILDSGAVNLINDTIADNTAGYLSGGIWVDSTASLTANNSIFWNNVVNTPGTGLLSAQLSGGTPANVLAGISNSIVQGLAGGTSGNLSFNPLFADESSGDYHLTSASPAVEAGNASWLLAGELDLDGNARLAQVNVDLGAYEYQGAATPVVQISLLPQSVTTCASNNVLFTIAAPPVNGYTYTWQQSLGADFTNLFADATYSISAAGGVGVLAISNVAAGLDGSAYRILIQNGSETATSGVFTLTVNPRSVVYVNGQAVAGGDGSSWSHAFVNLADAIGQGGCEDIWIAAGTYTPTNSATGKPLTIQLQEGMRLFGGFAGTETNLSQRNPALNHTILSAAPRTIVLQALGTAAPIDQSTRVDGLCFVGASNMPAVLLSGASPLLQNCVFATNSAGAVTCQGGAAPAFVNCAFSNNIGSSAILVQGATPTFTDCIFAGNQTTAGQNGGAVSATTGSTLTVAQCIFTNNSTAAAGGALSVDASTAMVVNSLFAYDSAAIAGAVSATNGATLTLINDTVADNAASVVGGVAVTGAGSVGYLTNCIFWNNGGMESAQLSGNMTVVYSCVQYLNQFAGAGNISSNPLFVNEAAGGFTLQTNSPCVDTGDDGALDSDLIDLAGAPRIQGYSVDMGAYESVGVGEYIQISHQPVSQAVCDGGVAQFVVAGSIDLGSNFVWQVNSGSGFATLALTGNYSVISNTNSSVLVVSNADVSLNGRQFRAVVSDLGIYSSAAILTVLPHGILYVNYAATGNNSGADWADAYTNLDSALAAADQCTEIWVAQGTYASTNNAGGPGFTLASGTAVYGGFAGAETNRSQRDSINNATLLTSLFQTNVMQITSGGLVDGFTITAGSYGVNGINIAAEAAPVVQNCVFQNNSGYALVNAGNGSSVRGCTFANGGHLALLNNPGSVLSVSNCVFSGNYGGAIKNQDAVLMVAYSSFSNNLAAVGPAIDSIGINSPQTWVDHCLFTANNANAEGTIWNGASGTLTVVNSLFYGNTAVNDGGGVTSYGHLTILSSTFVNNHAGSGAAAVACLAGSGTITNSILWGDTAGSVPSELSGSVTAWYSIVQNGANTGANNLPYDPQFVSPAAGNFSLPAYSPAVGVGYLQAAAGITNDLAGHPRTGAWGLDLGAYQGSSSPLNTVQLSTEPVTETACIYQPTVTFTYTGSANQDYYWALLYPGGGYDFIQNFGPGQFSINSVTHDGVVTSTLTISSPNNGVANYQYGVADAYGFVSAPASLVLTPPAVLYVNAAAGPGGDGASWATAFNDFQSALNAADSCHNTIWVAAGTYLASNTPSGTFQIPPIQYGLKIYGGFNGAETDISQRNWTNNPTLLTGVTSGSPVVGFDGSAGTIDNNTTLDGFVVSGGAGIAALNISQASPLLANCFVESNHDGGLVILGGTPLIQNCVFQGNDGGLAGAIYVENATPTFADILVSGNAGVALILSNSPATIINATIADNGNGLVSAGAQVNIYNSIFWNNGVAGTNVELGQLAGNVHVTFSCIEGLNLYGGNNNIGQNPLFLAPIISNQASAAGGNYRLYGSSPAIAVGNSAQDGAINVDLDGNSRILNYAVDMGAYEFTGTRATPLTVAALSSMTTYSGNAVTIYANVTGDGLTYQWQANLGQGWTNLTDGRNYSGTTTAALTILNPTLLLNGVQYRVIVTDDLGASTASGAATISVRSSTWYVSPMGANGDGHSWAGAFTNIQTALTSLIPGITNQQIWVTAGSYYPDLANTNATFSLPANTVLLGGFKGTETNASQRNWITNLTVFEGLLPGGGNSGTLLSLQNVSGVVVDGFQLRDALTAIASTNSRLTLSHCLFTGDNQAIAAYSGYLSLVSCVVSNIPGNTVIHTETVAVITNCVFANNPGTALYNGQEDLAGSVSVYGTLFVNNGVGAYTAPQTVPIFKGCTFAGNTHGLLMNNNGMIYIYVPNFQAIAAYAWVDNCQFITNSDSAIQGNGADIFVSRSQFRGNHTSVYGGGLVAYGGYVQIVDSLFSGNYAFGGGGALCQTANAQLDLNNCTIVANGANGPGGGILSSLGYLNTLINNCVFWDNYGPDNSGILGNSAYAQFYSTGNVGYPGYQFQGSRNDVQNNPDAGHSGYATTAANPMFVQPVVDGGTNAPTIAGDFHVGYGSPLIAAGALAGVADGSSSPWSFATWSAGNSIGTDLDGVPRLEGGIVDLGAYQNGVTYKFTQLQSSPGVGFQIQFTGTLSSYSVLWSSNLVNWTMYGVFTSQGDGVFQFTDTNAVTQPKGFYRVVSP